MIILYVLSIILIGSILYLLYMGESINWNIPKKDNCNKLSKDKCYLGCVWENNKCVKNKYYNLNLITNNQLGLKVDYYKGKELRSINYKDEYISSKKLDVLKLNKLANKVPKSINRGIIYRGECKGVKKKNCLNNCKWENGRCKKNEEYYNY